MEIRYKVYNPKMVTTEEMLTTEPMENDWVLLKIVPITEYEWVAVFQKGWESKVLLRS